MKKTGTLICIVLASLLLSACHGVSSAITTNNETAPEKGYGYQFVSTALPGEMILAISQYTEDGNIFICGMNSKNEPLLYRYTAEGVQSYSIPDGFSYLAACCATKDGLAVLAGDYPAVWVNTQKNTVENRQGQYSLSLLLYNRDGMLNKTISLDASLENGATYDSLLFVDEYYYLLNASDLLQLSSDGKLLNRRHLEGGQFVSQSNSDQGLTIALYNSILDGGENETCIERLTSSEQFSFETIYSNSDCFISGLGVTADDEIVFRANGAIERLTLNGKNVETVFSLRENGILSAPYTRIFPFDDGFLLAGRNQSSIDRLLYGPLPESEELLLWTSGYTDTLPNLVTAFNRSNPQYKINIEIVDPNDSSLQPKILAAEGPDLFYTGTGSPFLAFQSEMVFDDIIPYLERSAVTGLDSLLPIVQDAIMEEGKLYFLPIDIELYTMVCTHTNLLGEEISIEQAMELPEVQDGSIRLVTKECSRTAMWRWLSNMYLATHLDCKNGLCMFDTQEYTDLLKGCMLATTDDSAIAWDDAPYLFYHDSFPGLGRLLFWQVQCGNHFGFISDLGSTLSIPNAFSISKTSPHKEGAWKFLEYAFTQCPSDDIRFVLPASTDVLDRLLESGESIGFWYDPKEETITLDTFSIEQFRKLLCTPTVLMDRYPELIRIMNEEAEKFFAGDCSVEDSARATQSRAAIFMAERFG